MALEDRAHHCPMALDLDVRLTRLKHDTCLLELAASHKRKKRLLLRKMKEDSIAQG